MGLFSKPKTQQPAAREMLALHTEDGRWWNINYVSEYQPNLGKFILSKVPDFRYQHSLDCLCVLVPDPSLTWVENAVRVDIAGRTVGVLPYPVTADSNATLKVARESGWPAALVVQAKLEWDLKAGPYSGQVRLPRNFAKAELVPLSQMKYTGLG